ncbi:MAG: hypothetical protein ACFE89_01215 [Candidatus Hodarchaeota archaeon]
MSSRGDIFYKLFTIVNVIRFLIKIPEFPHSFAFYDVEEILAPFFGVLIHCFSKIEKKIIPLSL